MSMDGRGVFCSCKNDISAVRGGHILKMQDAYFEGMSRAQKINWPDDSL